ncbi:protein KHNYN [Trichomycterus rosablanca]|uniref:protein KHNYN n=1 Tax=Trichomycterus rosablanca TaxID=2290929 RepID=UPI002F357711
MMAQSGWRSENGGHQEVEDEFTCPAVLHASLEDLKPTVERVFGVTLVFGGQSSPYAPQDGQIWLHLKGRKEETEAAKLFIKGEVQQEAQEEVEYPSVLHPVFCGGFFTDCLIRNTSAHILVGSPECLLIYGLAEPVVKAYSLILDLVERYKRSQSQHVEMRSETMESQLAFRSLVEQLEDRNTLDLLVLPVLVKEVLLDLAKQAGLNVKAKTLKTEASAGPRTGGKLSQNMDRLVLTDPGGNQGFEKLGSSTASCFPQPDLGAAGTKDHSRNKDGEPKETLGQFFRSLGVPPELGVLKQEEELKERRTQQHDQNQEKLLFVKIEQENEHLLQFFTAMGFNKEVVCRVLAHTGPREPSEVLDLIQQEQNKVQVPNQNLNGASGTNKEDFVLGVLKKAAASCGYTEEKVDEIYSNLPELSPHEMILELQKKAVKEPEGGGKDTEDQRSVPRETKTSQKADDKPRVFKSESDVGRSLGETSQRKQEAQPGGRENVNVGPRMPEPFSDPPVNSVPSSVRGPPQPIYPHPLSVSDQQIPAPPEHTSTKPKQKAAPSRPGAVITGQQRFLEGLVKTFNLQLNDDPGDPGLRQIIIDGSNVAMTHGLGGFFSCRGIALAVQFFWSRGHRRITALVPQWRQKRDPKIKEQHFMTQLQDLGLLSFTPSREVQGQRINSYDDRFMLQLARSTDGVIITNDNMRDLVEESPVWREIIKSRLLQYVFAGDLFMVPDDPLGRSGPHIDHFLRSQSRPSVPISHSFAGVSSTPALPPPHPRAQTVPLQYRERAPAGPQHQGGSAPARTVQETLRIKQDLLEIFPGQDGVIDVTLQRHPALTDTNQLSYLILEHINTQEE